jgi:hypothetical protein
LFQKICPTTVYVTPNLSGVYDPSITCTVKTIRSSPNTSKVTEGIDFFAQKTTESHSSPQQPQSQETVSQLGLVHVSTNHFNGIEMTSGASTASRDRLRDDSEPQEQLSKLSLGERSTEGGHSSLAAGAKGMAEAAEVNVGVQSVKPTFAILNQHEGEEEEDLDDDPDADLDL